MKHLGTRSTKKMKLYILNYETLLEEIKEDLSNGKTSHITLLNLSPDSKQPLPQSQL